MPPTRRSGAAHTDGAAAVTDRHCHELTGRPDAVRSGRAFVTERLRAAGADALVDDAALVVAELLANAVQHGAPPVVVCAQVTAGNVRIEVHDGSSRSPVRPTPSLSNMTGRGLALVAALAQRWGVERQPDGPGKIVWAELAAGQSESVPVVDDVDALLASWADDDGEGARRHTVVLGDVPTGLLLEAKAHIDNLVREFSLAAAAGRADQAALPEHLARLIETVVHGFSDARSSIKRQALAAARRGQTRTQLTLNLPLSAADAGEAYLAALDDADEYARAARLLTLETPPEHRLFRRWYVENVVKQLRQVARGEQPAPVQSFEELLVEEYARLALAQRVGERMARLQRVTAALARARTPEDVADVVVSEGVAALGAAGGGLLVRAPDGEHLAVPGAVGYGEELVGLLREERIDAPLPAATALRTGVAVWLETQDERDRLFPELKGFEASTVAMCAVPLLVGSRTIGALRFSFSSRKLFDEDERQFVLALAAQTAQTLQRTEVYQAEREAALELQRALLPQDVPTIPGWDVAAHYSPADQQEAGGDFYDVIALPDGRIAAIVGDVMGRGVQAAAAMAQIRSTIRAYAVDDPDPAAVFTRVDAFFAALDVAQLVTVAYLLVDPDHNRVRVANAGHLPPLLAVAGDTEFVVADAGMPFGVLPQPRGSVEIQLPTDAAIVVVTDGLVERRGEDLDEGLERVAAALRGRAASSANDILRRVLRSSPAEGGADDDVTVLVLRRT